MRSNFLLALASVWLLPAIGFGQTSNAKAIADFYWRTGHYQAALFYTQLESSKKEVPPPPDKAGKPPTLEQLIADALKNNPDIRMAEAKLRMEEIELDRTRMKLVAEITTLHADIAAARATLEEGRVRYDVSVALFRKGAVSKEDFRAAELIYLKLKAELAAKEARLPYLLGRTFRTTSAIVSDDEFLRRVAKWIDQASLPKKEGASSYPRYSDPFDKGTSQPKLDSAMSDKLSKALNATIRGGVEFEQATLPAVIDYLRENALPGINLNLRGKGPKDATVNIKLTAPVPVGAVLQCLEDELGIVFIVRDYGIVVVTGEDRLPPGAERVVEFWKRTRTSQQAPVEKEKPKTPSAP